MASPDATPFDTLEHAFVLLGAGPAPLAVNGAAIGLGLPARPIPLPEMRALLLHPSTSNSARDAVVGLLVRKSRRRGGAWTVALAGALLPGLRRTATPLLTACPGKLADVQAEILLGLLEAAATFPVGAERAAARLVWAGVRRGHRLLTEELAERGRHVTSASAKEPPRPFRHPDFVLAEAVAAEVIDAAEGELIGETRIGEVPLRRLARAWGVPYDTLQKRRRRAELRLVEWLCDPDTDRHAPGGP